MKIKIADYPTFNTTLDKKETKEKTKKILKKIRESLGKKLSRSGSSLKDIILLSQKRKKVPGTCEKIEFGPLFNRVTY